MQAGIMQSWSSFYGLQFILMEQEEISQSISAREDDCMTWLYVIVLVFSILTLCFTCGAYKHNRFSKRAFSLVGIMEAVVIAALAVMLIMSP